MPSPLIERGLSLLLGALLLAAQALAAPVPVLEPLIAAVLASHPSQKSQALLLQSAQAGLEGAQWQFYPTPSVSVEQASTSATDPSYQGDSSVKTFSLQQPLWTGGRLTAGLQKAQANISVSQASMEEVRQQLALRVVQSYGDWMGAHLKILANERNMVTHMRLQAVVKRRIRGGLAPISDLRLAISRLEALESDTSVARAQHDIALARLGQLLGRPLAPESLRSALATAHAMGGTMPALLDQALAIYPGLLKAQSLAKVQEAVIAERQADLSPEVYLRAEQQYGNFSYRSSTPESRLFIGISSHFGAGLSARSSVEGAKAQYLAALAEIEAQGRIVSEQVLADYALAASSMDRLDSLEASLRAAQEVSLSYDRQFLAGRKTWLDVMNAARELVQTEVQLADVASAQVVVTWRLAIYTQGLAAVVDASP